MKTTTNHRNAMFHKNATQRFIFSIMLGAAIALASPVFANTNGTEIESAQKINAANQMLRDGDIDKAIAGYGEVVANEATRDELNYNMAVAQYRKSDIQAAASLFHETAGSPDASIAARSRFNLGNCLYATALQTAGQDKPAAIEQLRQAISHYRGSLRGQPDNNDARANIELAAEQIRKLEEEQKQEEQQKEQNQDQQNQDQQDGDQQDQDSQDSKPQDSESKDSESNQSQSENNDSQASESKQQPQDQNDESNSAESSDEESEQNESQDDSSQSQQTESQQNQSEDAGESQEPSEQEDSSQPNSTGEQLDRRNQPQTSQSQSGNQQENETSLDEEPGEHQSVPTGELSAAEQQDENKDPNGSVAMTDPNAKDGAMTQEEALKMLQAVRDRDMLRRLQQQHRERSRHVPVDKNW